MHSLTARAGTANYGEQKVQCAIVEAIGALRVGQALAGSQCTR